MNAPLAIGRPNKVLVADSKTLMREFITQICVSELGLCVVAQTATGPETIGEVLKTRPDVMLADVELPILDGFEVVERLKADGCLPRVLLISPRCTAYTVYRAERTFFHGYLETATATISDVRTAISSVVNRGVFYSSRFATLRAERQSRLADGFRRFLTKREMAILRMCGQLLSDQEIAARLDIASETVEKHRFNIQRKLNLRSRMELLRYARDHGFVTG